VRLPEHAREKIEELKRIRISSIEPTTIPATLLNRMADPKNKLCRYLHIPIQSGSDITLKNMKRLYSRQEFDDFIRQAVSTVKDICVGTDVIVGFPGESEEDFDTTVDYLRAAPIHYFHVFSYSVRHLAQSRLLGDALPAEMIQRRSQILRAISHDKRMTFYKSQLGKIQTVLFEQKKNGFWTGVTDNYLRVSVKDSGQDFLNTLRPVRLCQVNSSVIEGEIADE
jgi:threonylcarbamoyladenosine tRNA methylthiotransferase MtaB